MGSLDVGVMLNGSEQSDSLTYIIEKTARNISVKAKAINKLLEWQRNPGYAKFVGDKLETIEEFKHLIRDEYKEFSKVAREAYSQRNIDLGYSVCGAAYKMFKDFANIADHKKDFLFYNLGLAYFNSYETRFHLLDENLELAKCAMQKAKRNYKHAINLDLDSETREKFEKVFKKTEIYLKLYRPKKAVQKIGVTEDEVKDPKKLQDKIQRLYKAFPDFFDSLHYSKGDNDETIPSYDEIIKKYIKGEALIDEVA